MSTEPFESDPGDEQPTLVQRVHATDPDRGWWCPGLFDLSRCDGLVGVGHSASPTGWATHRCHTCGEMLFIGYGVDVGIPSWDEAAKLLAATA